MRGLRLTVSLLILSITPLYVDVSASLDQQIIEKAKKLYEGSDDLQMQFHQKISSGFFSKTDSASGEIFIKKPHRFILREQKQEIIYDGQTLWIYDKINSQVIKSASYSGRPFDPGEFLRRLYDEYKLVGSGEVGGYDCCIISVDSLPEMGISSVMLWVDKNNQYVRKLTYRDGVDSEVELLFDSIEFNVGLRDEQFEFTPPPEVEVIEW
jgi:outer membrane lipoprotein-sorting protein